MNGVEKQFDYSGLTPDDVAKLIDYSSRLRAELDACKMDKQAAEESLINAELNLEHVTYALSASQAREKAAVACIRDIETYLYLGSPKYIKKTIDEWRGPKEGGE